MMRISIYNEYLSTFGGGEKSTYDTASCLAAGGFDVEVLTFEDRAPTREQIEAFFGPGYGGFRIVALRANRQDPDARDEALRSHLRNTTVFINHCAGSSFVNPCPLGMYMVMFPLQPGGSFLGSYDHFICNSEYTRSYTRALWGRDLNTEVIHPCTAEQPPTRDEQRDIILALGRFNWLGHRKNQDLLVDAFDDVVDLLPPGWRLVLVGKLNEDPTTLAALDRLRRRARRLPVDFEVNCTEERKRQLLSRTALFWHGTGLGMREPQEAAFMEHFGIAVAEAMQAGAVPLCYSHGGPREIVEHTVSGFLFHDVEELKTFTLLLAADPVRLGRMRASAVARSIRFARPRFDREMTSFLRSVVAA